MKLFPDSIIFHRFQDHQLAKPSIVQYSLLKYPDHRSASYQDRLASLLTNVETSRIHEDIPHHRGEWEDFKHNLQQLVQAQPLQERRKQ